MCIYLKHLTPLLFQYRCPFSYKQASESLSKSLGIDGVDLPHNTLFNLYERSLFDPISLKRWLQRRPLNAPSLSTAWQVILGPQQGGKNNSEGVEETTSTGKEILEIFENSLIRFSSV